MTRSLVPPGASYEELRASFRWRLPERFNIGVACSDVHPAGDIAIVEVGDSDTREWTFGELSEQSNRLANAFRGLGVEPGMRVAFVLPQGMAAAVLHIGISKLGAVALPLSSLFGPDALRHRLVDSAARLVITGLGTFEKVAAVADEVGVPVICDCAEPAAPHRSLARLLEDASPRFVPRDTAVDDPAYLIYTSGTTASPRGVLHAHHSLFGHLPCIELGYDRFPRAGDRMWTPADWSWIGGMMDAFLPSLYYGVSVVAAARSRFDPEWAVRLIGDTRIRNAFIPPTALRMMKAGGVSPPRAALRSMISGGEALGAELLAWGRESLGVTISEIYGQTEANLLVGSAPGVFAERPGSMGKPYPGHDVAVIAEDGSPAATGADGEIALKLPDPVAFLGYLGDPEATAEKTRGGWLRTGDVARRDDDGYLWFLGRADDLIISAGYRISPLEVEHCLLQHAAVEAIAVVGEPDPTRGQIVKAFVVPAARFTAGPALSEELQAFVRDRLAAYEYPRTIEFVDELPQTVTGKIRRAALREQAVPST